MANDGRRETYIAVLKWKCAKVRSVYVTRAPNRESPTTHDDQIDTIFQYLVRAVHTQQIQQEAELFTPVNKR